jgi:hypothetical protein
MIPATETYKEAVSYLIDAVNALDQAHSVLKDNNLHDCVAVKLHGRWVNIGEAVEVTDGLLRDLQNVRCPDCDQPMAESEDCLTGNCPSLEGK